MLIYQVGVHFKFALRFSSGLNNAEWFHAAIRRWLLRNTSGNDPKEPEVSFASTRKSNECIIAGPDAYKLLRHEAGVHRVQRVPTTDAKRRVQTSSAAVAVLPRLPETEG